MWHGDVPAVGSGRAGCENQPRAEPSVLLQNGPIPDAGGVAMSFVTAPPCTVCGCRSELTLRGCWGFPLAMAQADIQWLNFPCKMPQSCASTAASERGAM